MTPMEIQQNINKSSSDCRFGKKKNLVMYFLCHLHFSRMNIYYFQNKKKKRKKICIDFSSFSDTSQQPHFPSWVMSLCILSAPQIRGSQGGSHTGQAQRPPVQRDSEQAPWASGTTLQALPRSQAVTCLLLGCWA